MATPDRDVIDAVRARAAHGWAVRAIARALRIPEATVREILGPPARRGVPARTAANGWGYRDVRSFDDDLVELPPPIAEAPAPELPRVEALGDADQAPPPMPGPPPAAEPWERNWGRVEARGSRNGRAVLDDEQAAEVRYLRDQGLQRDELAAMFGVSLATITRITRGQTYRDPLPPAAEDDQAAAELVTVQEQAPLPATSPVPAADRSAWGWRDQAAGPRRRNGPVEAT